MLTCLLLILPENSMQTMLTTLRKFNINNITFIQKLYSCNIEGPELSYKSITYMTNKLSRLTAALTVKHFMTIYDILSIFIAI